MVQNNAVIAIRKYLYEKKTNFNFEVLNNFPKQFSNVQFKGQTAVERVKGLEAEISRLDDIIHSKDEKIREMTSSRENLSGQQGALTAVNGEVPVEGMVIGEDEYVV